MRSSGRWTLRDRWAVLSLHIEGDAGVRFRYSAPGWTISPGATAADCVAPVSERNGGGDRMSDEWPIVTDGYLGRAEREKTEEDEWCEEHGHGWACPHDPEDFDTGSWD